MINLLEKLKTNKDKTLAQKSEELGVQQPTSMPIAKGVADTQKSAEMAASPQAKKSTRQKILRKSQVESQAPREISPEQETTLDRASNIISKLANFNQAAVEEQIGQTIEGQDTITRPVTSSEDYVSQMAQGQEVAAPTSAEVINDVLFEDADLPGVFNLTINELGDPDIINYAASVGLNTATSTVADLKNAVDSEINEITSFIDNARDIINDPNQPANVRQAAMQDLKDYGAAHLIATDAELDDFNKDAQSVGLISFGGKDYTIEDLGTNPAVLATLQGAAEMLIDDPNATPETLGLADNPLLFQFVKKHSNAINSILDSEKENLQAAKDAVASNKEVTSRMGEDLKTLLGVTEFTTDNIVSNTPGLAIFTGDYSPVDQGLTAAQVQEDVKYLAGKNPEYIKQLMSDPNFEDKIVGLANRASKLRSVENSQSRMDLAQSVGVDYSKFIDLMEDIKLYPSQYSAEQKNFIKIFDADGNGFYDNPASIKERLTVWFSDPNNKQPELNVPIFSQQVVDNYKEKINQKGIQIDNIDGFIKESLKDRDSLINNLRSVNRSLNDMEAVIKKYPNNDTLQAMYRRLQYARRVLVRGKGQFPDKVKRSEEKSPEELYPTLQTVSDLFSKQVPYSSKGYSDHVSKLENTIAELEGNRTKIPTQYYKPALKKLRLELAEAKSIRNSFNQSHKSSSTGSTSSESVAANTRATINTGNIA